MADIPPDEQANNGVSALALAEDWPTLEVLDRRYIDLVLDKTGGNKTRAAEVLGIDRRTLSRIFAREKAAYAKRKALEEKLFGKLEKAPSTQSRAVSKGFRR